MEPRGSSACVSWIRTCTRTPIRPPPLLRHAEQHRVLLSYLLEVYELGFVCVQVEAGAVVADRVPADGRRGVLELLRDVFDQRLAVHTLKGPADLRPQRRPLHPTAPSYCRAYASQRWKSYQFGVHRMCSHHLTADFHQRANAHGRQLANPTSQTEKQVYFRKYSVIGGQG